MSGLEVAGVVLGAIPIIICAMENYESSLDRARAFWKWQDELEKAIRELWIQHSSFEMTLRNLLKEVASPAEAQEMIQDFGHWLWSSTALSDAFEERLGAAFGVYIHTIREMESYMMRLARNLDLDRQTVR
ncbi:hypothetical protein IMZ48_16975 [Candidatus Bathyarchaeota archaeon]|nr:hypothetical protein [Candidatus Bathyarchaeota archaeon]